MMGDYSIRAQFYHIEFNVVDDFPVIRTLLEEVRGKVLDIPSGIGRLIPLYAEMGEIEVHLVDKEPEMYKRCTKRIEAFNLGDRVFAHIGDMRKWSTSTLFSLILVPRGGLQILSSFKDVIITLQNIRRQMKRKALLYVDIHNPWADYDSIDSDLLPEFMRFQGNVSIEGEKRFALPNGGILIRKFRSQITESMVIAYFDYVLCLNGICEQKYSAKGQWLRIDANNLIKAAHSVGLRRDALYGDYHFSPLSPTSARITAIFRAM